MQRSLLTLGLLAVASTPACVRDPQTPAPAPTDPDEEMPAPCDDYAVGENAEGDDACFAWASVGCAAATSREACEVAVDIASPKGDLACAWPAETLVVELADACTVIDRAPRCVSVRGAGADAAPPCDGNARWTHVDEETGELVLVELDCSLEPVPDYEPCLDETAASAACTCE